MEPEVIGLLVGALFSLVSALAFQRALRRAQAEPWDDERLEVLRQEISALPSSAAQRQLRRTLRMHTDHTYLKRAMWLFSVLTVALVVAAVVLLAT